MQIDKITAINDELQLLDVTITKGGDSYGYKMNTPILEGDALEAYCNAREFKSLNNILYQVYDRKVQFPSEEEWDEWIDDGCIIPEITKEVSHPEIEAKDAVYKQDVLVAGVEAQDAVYKAIIVSKAVEAKDAVMGTRQKEVVTEEEEEVSNTEIVEEDGKYIQKITYKTITKENAEPQWEIVPLYNEEGYEIGEHKIPIMEDYEVEPAVEAVDEVTEEMLISEAVEAVEEVLGEEYLVSEAVEAVDAWEETIIVRPEEVIKKQPWVNTH